MSKRLFTIRSSKQAHQFARKGKGRVRPVWSAGLLFNQHAWWVGVHYSNACHRWCINILPCLTVWVRGFGGHEP